MILPLLLLLSQSLQRLLKISLMLPSIHQALHSVLRARLDVLHHQLRPLGHLCTKNLRLMVDTSPILLSPGGNSQLVRRIFRVLSMMMTCSVRICFPSDSELIHHPLLRCLSPQITFHRLILSLTLQLILLLSQLLLCLLHFVSAMSCLPLLPQVMTNSTSSGVTMRTPSSARLGR